MQPWLVMAQVNQPEKSVQPVTVMPGVICLAWLVDNGHHGLYRTMKGY